MCGLIGILRFHDISHKMPFPRCQHSAWPSFFFFRGACRESNETAGTEGSGLKGWSRFLPTRSKSRPGHEMRTTLGTLVDELYWDLDEGSSPILVMLDFPAAFTTINHAIVSFWIRFGARRSSGFSWSGSAAFWVCSYSQCWWKEERLSPWTL